MHDYRTAYQSCLTENRDSNHKLINFKMKDTQLHKQLANFVINENLFAFFDGLDCQRKLSSLIVINFALQNFLLLEFANPATRFDAFRCVPSPCDVQYHGKAHNTISANPSSTQKIFSIDEPIFQVDQPLEMKFGDRHIS
jgi:hypothetical protein